MRNASIVMQTPAHTKRLSWGDPLNPESYRLTYTNRGDGRTWEPTVVTAQELYQMAAQVAGKVGK